MNEALQKDYAGQSKIMYLKYSNLIDLLLIDSLFVCYLWVICLGKRIMDEENPFEGCLVDGKYRIGKKIGDGSYGEVFLGNYGDGKIAAIKIIDLRVVEDIEEGLRENVLSRLRNQPVLLHKFKENPCVVDILDSYQYQSHIIIVMEYCLFGNLEDYLSLRGYLSQSEAVLILKHILYGLTSLHVNHLWHRDLKPANILGKYRKFVLADFGEMKQNYENEKKGHNPWSTVNMTATLVGTLQFKAPQILLGEKYSYKVDIFSVFLIFYQMLTGVNAFMFEARGQNEELKDYEKKLADKMKKYLEEGLIYREEHIKQMAMQQNKYYEGRFNSKISDEVIKFMKNFLIGRDQRKGWKDIIESTFLMNKINNEECFIAWQDLDWSNCTTFIKDYQKLYQEINEIFNPQQTFKIPKVISPNSKSIQKAKEQSQKHHLSHPHNYKEIINSYKVIYFQRRRLYLLRKKFCPFFIADEKQWNKVSELIKSYESIKEVEIDEKESRIQELMHIYQKEGFYKHILQVYQKVFRKSNEQKSEGLIIGEISKFIKGISQDLKNQSDENFTPMMIDCEKVLKVRYDPDEFYSFLKWRNLDEYLAYSQKIK